MKTPNHSIQQTEASRLAINQIQPQRRLTLVADAERSAAFAHRKMSDEKKTFIEHDEFCVSLTVSGDDLDPDEITRLLGTSPTEACRLGDPIPLRNHTFTAKSGSWSISTERSTCDIEEQLTELFAKLNGDPAVWRSLTSRYDASLFCGVFLSWFGHGFSMSPSLHRLLADRNLVITFDIYDEYDHDA